MKFFVLFFISFIFSVSANAANLKQFAKKNKEPLHVTSQKLTVFDKKGLYEFIGNVVAKKGDVTLKADKVDVFRNNKTGDIEKIVCTGNVVITKQNKKAVADKAIYEDKQQKITLIGNASVTSDKNKIKSDMIIYFIDKDYAVAQSTNAKKRVEVTIYPNKKRSK